MSLLRSLGILVLCTYSWTAWSTTEVSVICITNSVATVLENATDPDSVGDLPRLLTEYHSGNVSFTMMHRVDRPVAHASEVSRTVAMLRENAGTVAGFSEFGAKQAPDNVIAYYHAVSAHLENHGVAHSIVLRNGFPRILIHPVSGSEFNEFAHRIFKEDWPAPLRPYGTHK